MPDLPGLSLADYSDRELLLAIIEHQDAEGWTNSRDLANVLGVHSKNPTQSVGSRLAWLKRYGAVERDGEAPTRTVWRVTPMGALLARGELRAADRRALDALKPDHMLLATRLLAARARQAPDTAAHLMKREWRRAAVMGRNGTAINGNGSEV